MPEISKVAEDDQGIDWDREVRQGIYLLKQMSSGEASNGDGSQSTSTRMATGSTASPQQAGRRYPGVSLPTPGMSRR